MPAPLRAPDLQALQLRLSPDQAGAARAEFPGENVYRAPEILLSFPQASKISQNQSEIVEIDRHEGMLLSPDPLRDF